MTHFDSIRVIVSFRDLEVAVQTTVTVHRVVTMSQWI